MFLCFLDESGRTLTDKSLSQLTAEFMKIEGVRDLTNYSGPSLNSPEALKRFVKQVGIENCVVVFLSNKNRPFRLTDNQLSRVCDILDSKIDSSSEAIRIVLAKDSVMA